MAPSCAAYVDTSAAASAPARTAMMTGVPPEPAKSSWSVSATVRALWSVGITDASIGVQFTRAAGRASARTTSAVAAATAPGRLITACVRRYQRPRSSGASRRLRSDSLAPHRPNRAGEITRAATAATTATIAPAMPIDFTKPSGKTVRVIIAAATVAAEKATVRPAVRMVVATACGVAPWTSTSSR
jgi:hypothetical protein